MGCGDEKLSKSLTQTFTAHGNAMICQQVTLSGDAEWPKVADAVIEAALLPLAWRCCAMEDSPCRYVCTAACLSPRGTKPPCCLRVILHLCQLCTARKERRRVDRLSCRGWCVIDFDVVCHDHLGECVETCTHV